MRDRSFLAEFELNLFDRTKTRHNSRGGHKTDDSNRSINNKNDNNDGEEDLKNKKKKANNRWVEP